MNKTKNIPYKVMATSALATMTVVSGLGLNAISANASQVNKSSGNTVLVNTQSQVRKESEQSIANLVNDKSFVNKVNHIVRDDNVNYDYNSSYFAAEPEDFAMYKVNVNTARQAIKGNKQAQQSLADDMLGITNKQDQVAAVQSYNFLRANYLHEHKRAVYVTATRSGNVYKNAKLTRKSGKSFKENNLFKIKRIFSVHGKQRFELSNEQFISGYHAVINQDFTNNRMLTHMFNNVKYINRKSRSKLAKRYYTRINRGRHIAITKKSVVKHTNASFGDLASLKQRNHVRKGTKLYFKRIVRHGDTFRLQLTNGRYVTANKAYVRVIK